MIEEDSRDHKDVLRPEHIESYEMAQKDMCNRLGEIDMLIGILETIEVKIRTTLIRGLYSDIQ